jgi:hypothetical protein
MVKVANPNLLRVIVPNGEVPLKKVTLPVGKLPEVIAARAPVFSTGRPLTMVIKFTGFRVDGTTKAANIT